MPGIGIISSIDFENTTVQDSFNNGAKFPANTTFKYADKLGFSRQTLADGVNRFNNDGTINLIVTVGGLITCNEAIVNTTKPVISLIGWLPSAPFPQPANGTLFRGCVSLNSFSTSSDSSDQTRINWIHANWRVPIGNVTLFYDPNTAMASQEVTNWGGGQPFASSANPNNYADEFQNGMANFQAIVISASPAHHRYREQLISAANACGKYICYPLSSYQNAHNKPAPGRSVIIGPDLDGNNPNGAYFRLGAMAAIVLAGNNPPQVIDNVPQGAPNPL